VVPSLIHRQYDRFPAYGCCKALRLLYYPTMKRGKQVAGPALGGGGDWVSPIRFRVDVRSGVPIYLQIVRQVEHALRLGHLRLDDQLPRIRDVVGSLSINPNTVAKAYRELEHTGYVAGRPGQGTFIVAVPDTAERGKFEGLREGLVYGWLSDARAAGLSEQEIIALFTTALREVSGGVSERPKLGGRREAVA
jgi:GntR family transcriptional regulator